MLSYGQTPRAVGPGTARAVEDEAGRIARLAHQSPFRSGWMCLVCVLFPASKREVREKDSSLTASSTQLRTAQSHLTSSRRVQSGPHTAWARLERGPAQAFLTAQFCMMQVGERRRRLHIAGRASRASQPGPRSAFSHNVPTFSIRAGNLSNLGNQSGSQGRQLGSSQRRNRGRGTVGINRPSPCVVDASSQLKQPPRPQ